MIEMKILKDRSEWLENRKSGIGGSEISAVIGCNPYLDNVALWELKTGRKQAKIFQINRMLCTEQMQKYT